MTIITIILTILTIAALLFIAYKQTLINNRLTARVNQLIDLVDKLQKDLATHITTTTIQPTSTPHVSTDTTTTISTRDDNTVTTLYLSRADSNGIFTRASASCVPGSSLFTLQVNDDGQTGTFSVIDEHAVMTFALMMPTQNLTTACEGPGIQVSGNATVVVTDVPGKAVRQGDTWRVTTRAIIHYE